MPRSPLWPFLLLLAMAGWLGLMRSKVTFPSPTGATIAGISQPGLAMQFAGSPKQVDDLLESAKTEKGQAYRDAMEKEQYFDFVFILTYWLVFVFAIAITMKHSDNQWAERIRILVIICASATAILDVLENLAILSVIGKPPHLTLLPHSFGPYKWLFFFLSMGASAPLFLLYPKFGHFGQKDNILLRFLAWLDGAWFLVAAVVGIAWVVKSFSDDASLLALSQLCFFAAFVFFFVLVSVAGAIALVMMFSGKNALSAHS
jgi:hypothetical protein